MERKTSRRDESLENEIRVLDMILQHADAVEVEMASNGGDIPRSRIHSRAVSRMSRRPSPRPSLPSPVKLHHTVPVGAGPSAGPSAAVLHPPPPMAYAPPPTAPLPLATTQAAPFFSPAPISLQNVYPTPDFNPMMPPSTPHAPTQPLAPAPLTPQHVFSPSRLVLPSSFQTPPAGLHSTLLPFPAGTDDWWVLRPPSDPSASAFPTADNVPAWANLLDHLGEPPPEPSLPWTGQVFDEYQ